MDESTRQLFSRQLAAWAEAAIEHGRFPFRKVETYPELVTAQGLQHPPLVFWINRDSCMAGGVVFFPAEADVDLERAGACAEALGLGHLVSWGPREIVFWERREASFARHRTVELGDSSPSRFREALLAVMEELKLLAVLGAVPPEALSPHYLANLCLGTRSAALPSLIETFRLARSDERLERDASATALAERKAAMTLLRLLGLVFFDKLPSTVQPEDLERAMRFALDGLPEDCRRILEIENEEVPLSEQGAILFHHLFRRLNQLGLRKDRPRCIRLLEILFAQNAPTCGAHPLPGPPDGSGEELLLHPDRLPSQECPMLVASPPLLASVALIRQLSNAPPLRFQSPDLFALTPEAAPQYIRGSLRDEHAPTGQLRRSLAARLRVAWPARRFSLPPRTPTWLWELLHLLGIAPAGARIDIAVPASWLTNDFGLPLMEVLGEQFSLDRLALEEEKVHLHLHKTREARGTTRIEGPAGPRDFSLDEGSHPSRLMLALHLPEAIYSLLEREILLPAHPSAPCDRRGAVLFCRSSTGRLLWSLVSGRRPLPPEKKLPEEIFRRGMPLPEGRLLAHLAGLFPSDSSEEPSPRRLDRELELWLGALPASPLPALHAETGRRTKSGDTGAAPKGGSEEEIAAEVFVDGLPRFPEQYLYDYYRPQLEEYRFAGPLSAGEVFFGRHRLHDTTGAILEVEGEETARALLLASHADRCQVELPANRRITADILERYLADLRRLHRKLLRETHLRTTGGRAAENLARKIWHSRPLPPWELIETS